MLLSLPDLNFLAKNLIHYTIYLSAVLPNSDCVSRIPMYHILVFIELSCCWGERELYSHLLKRVSAEQRSGPCRAEGLERGTDSSTLHAIR